MSVNDRDLSAIEYLAARIREDTPGAKAWDGEGTHVVFAREFKGKHLVTVLEDVLHHAADVNAKTPAAVTRPFKPKLVDPLPRGAFPPKASEECPDHIGELPQPYCRVHATEHVRAYYDTEPVETIHGASPVDIRNELRKAQQR